jgi:hypothetical protein
MSIPVICPGCKSQFRVSEKFAGKEGPCPKCKAPIKVPAKGPEVQVHAPEEFAAGGRDSKGRLVAKPIPRFEERVRPTTVAVWAAGGVATVAAAWAIGKLENVVAQNGAIALGLLALSPPLAALGYTLLRSDEELGPLRGRDLWLRAGICGAAYAALWGALAALDQRVVVEYWSWLYFAPPFLALGSVTALAAFNLDLASGFFHYAFYLLVTLLLRWVAGLQPLWALGSGPQ